MAFSPKTARTRNTHKRDDMFGRQRKKPEGQQRHQYEVAKSNVIYRYPISVRKALQNCSVLFCVTMP